MVRVVLVVLVVLVAVLLLRPGLRVLLLLLRLRYMLR